ncbi:cache domain-containing protein [Prochlorothrix hollandica]|uniref:cache domain-containing protein n=1 Tax=Prochlorothrix hollandica TaxID=1223 RepID=UPI0011D2366E|nr:cache domain-containing protein [Prochlorothrix hollandica]
MIEEPLKPVVRYATPVYSAEGQQRGIVIINVKMDPLFQQAENNTAVPNGSCGVSPEGAHHTKGFSHGDAYN